jgi:hypothetical protein
VCGPVGRLGACGVAGIGRACGTICDPVSSRRHRPTP